MEFIVISLIKAAVVLAVLLTTLAYLQWVERKVIAHIQVRPGPYRVGPHGLLQPLADVIKLITKEDLMPPHASKLLFVAAPFISVTTALISISVIPFGPAITVAGHRTWMQLTDLSMGVLFVLAVSSMGVYGIALAGWASNNKYALLGGLRSSAQMISYELPLSLAIASPLLLSNTLSLRELVESQSATGSVLSWNILHGPFPQIFSFVIFLISAFAETNRIPFDLPEAENELVAGYHTEYSGFKFAMFYLGEYVGVTLNSAMLLFLGGWVAPWPAAYGSGLVPTLLFAAAGVIALSHGLRPARRRDRYSLPVFGIVFLAIAVLFLLPVVQGWLLPLFWFLAKTGALLFTFIWVRGTLPRFRYDQLMGFAWKFLFPIAVVNLLVTGLLVAWFS